MSTFEAARPNPGLPLVEAGQNYDQENLEAAKGPDSVNQVEGFLDGGSESAPFERMVSQEADESADEKIGRIRQLGSKVVEFAQGVGERLPTPNLTPRTKGLAVLATTAALFGVGAASLSQQAEGTTKAQASATKVTHRHSSLNAQKILNKIRHAAAPIYQTAQTQPVSGLLDKTMATYKSDCAFRTGGPYKYLRVTEGSISYKSCGLSVPPYDPEFKPGHYDKVTDKLGSNILSSVKLNYKQSTNSVKGNRKKVTATYQCQTPGVKKISISKKGRATITRC